MIFDAEYDGGGLKYRLLKESTANKTFAYQLAELESTFTGLSNEEKERCILVINYDVYIIQNTYNGDFYELFQNSAHIIVGIFLSIRNKTRYSGAISGALSDGSTDTNSGKIGLYMLKDSD